ncbi:MAG: TolC family protein [Myxococcota bacterium]
MSDRTTRFTAAALCLLLSACAPALKDLKAREASLAMPESFEGQSDGPSLAEKRWEELFADPHLVGLIDQALKNNQELGILFQETVISGAELRAKRGEVLPKVDLAAGVGMEKVGLTTSQGVSDEAHEVPEYLGDFRVGLEASWEVDIWKRLRNASKAARLRYLSTIEGRNFVVTTIVAELADSYYELMALDNQLKVVETNIQILTDSLEVVKLQKEAARVTELGVQRFEAELLRNQGHQYELRQEIVETENRINLLCGRMPQPVERSSDAFATLPPRDVGLGTPAMLLENRPDVRAAELRLEAAKLDVKSARAMFYPSLGIDGRLGYEAYAIAKLGATPESLLIDAAGRLVAPLLNRSAINANYRTANAQQMQAVLDYERTLLEAYTEVTNRRSRLENLNQSYQRKAEQVQTLEQAIETSTVLFRSARADYLEVLTTRREALESQMELIETKQRQLSAEVDLYQALGGGWRPSTSATN